VKVSTAKSNHPSSHSGFVPATPHTRKVQAQDLFQGSTEAVTESGNFVPSGRIDVSPSVDGQNDDSVLINYGSQTAYIPNVLSYWKSDATGKRTFNASVITHSDLPSTRALGGKVGNISMLPAFPNERLEVFGPVSNTNFMLSTSLRLVFFVTPLTDSTSTQSSQQQLQPYLKAPYPLSRDATDQSLLEQRSLDVDGMDRILGSMESPAETKLSKPAPKAVPNFGKSVGFAQDVDMDMTPDAPSPVTKKKLQLSSKKSTERRLFS
jgi:hypothetical protein